MSTSEQFLACTNRYELAAVLDVKVSTLTYFAYGSGKKYNTFTIPKSSGGVREIFAPIGGLKSLQRKLAVLLNEIYPAPAYVHGFIKGRGIVGNADIHVGKRVVLNFDLKDFFPSITVTRIIGLLKAHPFNFNKEVASSIAGLVCYNGFLPQGAPTSPILSNIICFRLDRALLSLAKKEHVSYTRYADDITISTRRRKLSEAILKQGTDGKLLLGSAINEILSFNHFQVNEAKTRVNFGSQAKYVTSIKVNSKPNVSKTYVRQIRAMLNALCKYGPKKAQIEYSTKYNGNNKDFIQVVRGKIAHLKNIKGDTDLVYRRLYNKFVSLEGKGRSTLPESEIEELYRKIFVIKAGKNQGTGFILNERFLVTCEHLLDGEEIEYFNYNDYPAVTRKKVKVEKALSSSTFDIALITPHKDDCLPGKSFSACSASENIQSQQSYRVIGFPHYQPGMQPRIMRIEVTGIDPTKYGIPNAFVDKQLVSGNSGGPVLNDNNEVVGVVARGTYSASTGNDWSGYAFIPLNEVRKFAKIIGVSI